MTPRHLLKRYLGDRHTLANSRATSWLGARIHDAEIWHLGRRSVAGGVSLGFFLAFVPLPVQMVIAAPLALLFRVNLPVTLICLWITNPLTMAPMFIFAFKIGTWILGQDMAITSMHFEPTFDGILVVFGEIWPPLLVGCFICGISTAAVGNLAVRWLWRGYLVYRRRQRRRMRLARGCAAARPLPGEQQPPAS